MLLTQAIRRRESKKSYNCLIRYKESLVMFLHLSQQYKIHTNILIRRHSYNSVF